MFTTLALALVTSLPMPAADIGDALGDILIGQMSEKRWPRGFAGRLYERVEVERGAVTSFVGGFCDNELYVQVPTFIRINHDAPRPLLNRHVHCNNHCNEAWTCTDRTSWTGDFDPEVWHTFDIPLADTAADILNEL